MRYKIPLREAQRRFQDRELFCCNDTLTGHHGAPWGEGRLPSEWALYIRQFRRGIVYTVESYATPIAWVMRDGRVIVPPVRYSQTTGRHLSKLGLRYSQPVRDGAVAA